MTHLRPVLLVAACLIGPSVWADEPARPLSRIAFGSCAHQDRPQPIWAAVLAARPDLFLFLGDNVYGDTDDMGVLRGKYAKLAGVPGFVELRKTCPVLATWDDHDYGLNDAGADYPKRAESQREFLDFWGEPADSPLRKQAGVYRSQVFGPPGQRVQVILLDTRYHRSPLKKGPKRPEGGVYVANDDPSATVLGEEQWKWLAERLREPAELRLIASSIQVVPEDHGFEKWMNFPRERERLFATVRDAKAEGVVFLSGDRHLAELSVMDAGLGYPAFDLTSSGLNMGAKAWRAPEANRHRVGTMTHGNNFGLVAVEWGPGEPRVSLQVRDEDGDVVVRQKLRLGTLGTKPVPAVAATLGALTPAQAAKKVGEAVTVEFVVKATGMTKDKKLAFLNSEEDYRSKDNFTVALEMGRVGDKLSAEPAKLVGKTVRVTGKVTVFRDAPQIRVEDAKQIEVVEP